MASIVVEFDKTDLAPNELQAVYLRATVLSAVDMPSKIFVTQSAASPNGADQFICLADPVDLEEFPEDAPDMDAEIPYYRVNTITLAFRSVDDLLETKTMLKADIEKLVASVNAAVNLREDEVVTYGT